MDNDEILKFLKNKKIEFVSEIEHNNKQYIKTIKMQKHKPKFIYYEIDENNIKEVEDIQLLDYFKTMYEVQPSDIIY